MKVSTKEGGWSMHSIYCTITHPCLILLYFTFSYCIYVGFKLVSSLGFSFWISYRLVGKYYMFYSSVGSSNWKSEAWQPWVRQELWDEAKAWWWYRDWWKILGGEFLHSHLPQMQGGIETWCETFYLLCALSAYCLGVSLKSLVYKTIT